MKRILTSVALSISLMLTGLASANAQDLTTLTSLASQGNIKAQYQLAQKHELGQGTPKDIDKADYWYKRAALNNDLVSQSFLAFKYQDGANVKIDLIEAYVWHSMAAKNTSDIAHEDLRLASEKQLEQLKLTMSKDDRKLALNRLDKYLAR